MKVHQNQWRQQDWCNYRKELQRNFLYLYVGSFQMMTAVEEQRQNMLVMVGNYQLQWKSQDSWLTLPTINVYLPDLFTT
jgi:hypothetical protein